jgi:hypothetical protein
LIQAQQELHCVKQILKPHPSAWYSDIQFILHWKHAVYQMFIVVPKDYQFWEPSASHKYIMCGNTEFCSNKNIFDSSLVLIPLPILFWCRPLSLHTTPHSVSEIVSFFRRIKDLIKTKSFEDIYHETIHGNWHLYHKRMI